MVRSGVHSEETGAFSSDPQVNVDPDQLHLVVNLLELDIIVDALRSVGNSELADRFEAIMRRLAEPGGRADKADPDSAQCGADEMPVCRMARSAE
jgi:hypothetical protein